MIHNFGVRNAQNALVTHVVGDFTSLKKNEFLLGFRRITQNKSNTKKRNVNIVSTRKEF